VLFLDGVPLFEGVFERRVEAVALGDDAMDGGDGGGGVAVGGRLYCTVVSASWAMFSPSWDSSRMVASGR